MTTLAHPEETAHTQCIRIDRNTNGIRKAFRSAMLETFEGYGLFNKPIAAESISPSASQKNVCWTAVTTYDPLPGQFVFLMPESLQREIYAHITLDFDFDDVNPETLADVQMETTNVLAGRTINILLGGAGSPSLGLPLIGDQVPDVRKGRWEHFSFEVGYSWMLAFIRGKELLSFGCANMSSLVRKSGFLASVNISKFNR